MSSETISVTASPRNDPKLDDMKANQNPPESEDYSSDEEGYEHMTDEEIIEYRRYRKQLNESDGFDVDFAPKAFQSSIGGGPNLPRNLSDPAELEITEKCTCFAIDQYNKLMKGKSWLQLVQIPKANGTSLTEFNCIYRITFDAVDTVSRHCDTYQTHASYCSLYDTLTVFFMRKKGQKKDMCFPLDLDDEEECVWINKRSALAISEYNEYEEKYSEEEQREYSALDFVKVVKAVRNMRMRYWITFEAKDTKSEQVNSYFAEMICDDEGDVGLRGRKT